MTRTHLVDLTVTSLITFGAACLGIMIALTAAGITATGYWAGTWYARRYHRHQLDLAILDVEDYVNGYGVYRILDDLRNQNPMGGDK